MSIPGDLSKTRMRPRQTKRYRVNDQIRIPQVRLIDEKGEDLGEVPTWRAKSIARERGLDLVEIAPNQRPPIAKLMNYGKFAYEQAKKQRQTKTQRANFKVLMLGVRTSPHDLQTKARKIDEFLEGGSIVRLQIRLRGREKAHPELAQQKLNEFIPLLEQEVEFESEPKKRPDGLHVVLKPSTK